MYKWKNASLLAGLSLTLAVAGCGSDDSSASGEAASASKEMEYEITGIEPGAGQTQTNEKAIAEYESLSGWEQETSSAAAMLTELDEAISKEEPIVVAAWSPHYMFAKFDIKYLEDPKQVFGEEEHITTLTRQGLEDDMPEAYTILDRLHWELDVFQDALLLAQEMDFDYEKVAEKWVEENPDKVAEWTEGVEAVDGTSIDLVMTTWDAENFSTNVAKIVLEEKGFDVSLTPVDPSIMFSAIASGDSDATLSPWMPATHGALYEEYEGDFEDLGANLEGARIGLAVPSYMEIDSLEDLEPAE